MRGPVVETRSFVVKLRCILKQGSLGMAKRAKSAFDPKVFLATTNHNRTLISCPKDDVVYSQ